MKPLSSSAQIIKNKDIGIGYGTLVSLDFHNLPSLYPSSFCRNDFLYFIINGGIHKDNSTSMYINI